MNRHLKLIIAGFVLGLLPFVLFLGFTSYSVENGVLTGYTYLNLAAIIGGIAAVAVGIALLRRDPERGDRPPGWVLAVGAVVLVLGAFQIVRGSGVLTDITDCVSETGSMGFCKTTNV